MDVDDHRKIWNLINAYNKDPEKVISKVRKELQEGGVLIGN